MIRSLFLTALLVSFGIVHGQQSTTSCSDSLLLQADGEMRCYLQWHLGRYTNLNTIAKATGQDVQHLYALNPILQFKEAGPCDRLISGFHPRFLGKYIEGSTRPVFYRVKEHDTVYGIAKRLLHIPADSLMKMNRLSDLAVKTGQLLFVGWLDISGNHPPEAPLTGEPIALPTSTPATSFNRSPDKHYATRRGVAIWNKDKEDPNLFALHRDAPLNSLIEIKNPMFGRTVVAKVIGTIPPTYKEDVTLIVSQGVAQRLGAIDGRFYVEMSYEVR